MKVIIETDRCIGSGQCVRTAPDVFDQRDEDGCAVLLMADPPMGRIAEIRSAEAGCPAAAIRVEP
jgi:ferredoxin